LNLELTIEQIEPLFEPLFRHSVMFLQNLRPIVARRSFSTFLFDKTTAIRAAESEESGFVLDELSNEWSISGIPNGGYCATIAISAAREAVPSKIFRDCISVDCHFITRAKPFEPVILLPRIIHQGKSLATVAVDFKQSDKVISTYLMTLGSLAKFQGPAYNGPNKLLAPVLPKPEDCIDASKVLSRFNGGAFNIFNNFDVLVHPDDNCKGLFDRKSPKLGDTAASEGYIRFKDGRPPCLRSNAIFLDAWFPPILNIHLSSWVPTLQMGYHFWNRGKSVGESGEIKRDGWVRCRFSTSYMANGMLHEFGECWDADDDILFATSRQQALILQAKKI